MSIITHPPPLSAVFNTISWFPFKVVVPWKIYFYFWSVFSCVQSEYRKIRTRNNSVFRHFSRSACLVFWYVFFIFKSFCVISCGLFLFFNSVLFNFCDVTSGEQTFIILTFSIDVYSILMWSEVLKVENRYFQKWNYGLLWGNWLYKQFKWKKRREY